MKIFPLKIYNYRLLAKKRSVIITQKLEKRFQSLLEDLEREPRVISVIILGSRGKGFVTNYSDYDFDIVVTDGFFDEAKAIYGHLDEEKGFDVGIYKISDTLNRPRWVDKLTVYIYNLPNNGHYTYAHLKPPIDKTGEITDLLKDLAKIPEEKLRLHINGSLDHYINQVYRSFKSHRDGYQTGYRLEAAESVLPLLNAIFALDGQRYRPFYKYIEWELEHFPLTKFPWSGKELLSKILIILETADYKLQQEIMKEMETAFKKDGYGEIFDEWDMKWIYNYPTSDYFD